MKEDPQMQESLELTPDYVFNFRKGSFIHKNGEELFLENRLKAFFTLLLTNKNDAVSRDDLMAFVWKDLVVSDESVTKAASDLRKFIKTHHIKGLSIRTISKLGYKLEIEDLDLKVPAKAHYGKRLLKIAG